MKAKEENVPALRFPGFDGEWKTEDLKDIAGVYDGTHQTPKYTKKGIRFVSVENINNIYGADKFISKEAFEKNFKTKPQKDDILMTRITAGIIGATAVIRNNDPLGYYVSLALIRKKDSTVNTDFLNYRINSELFKHELHKRIIHVAFPKKINLGEIGRCKISITSLPEQQKIASFLTAVDSKIEQLSKKKALLEQFKKGMMQKLFSQELRFKDELGNEFPEWEEKRLGEIASNISYGLNCAAVKFDSLNRYIRITDIDDSSRKYIPKPLSSPAPPFDESYLVKKGDILFARTGASVGKSYLYNEKDGRLFFAGFLIRFSIKHANPYFIFSQTLSANYRKWVKVVSMRSGQPGINAEEFKIYKLVMPSIEEQQKITDFLSSIDKKIDLITTELNHAQSFKKSLLQQMFI